MLLSNGKRQQAVRRQRHVQLIEPPLPLANPLPKLVFFRLAQTTIVNRVSFDVTVNGSHELPHGHSSYFLRRKAERCAVAVDRGKSDFSVGETVKLFSA